MPTVKLSVTQILEEEEGYVKEETSFITLDVNEDTLTRLMTDIKLFHEYVANSYPSEVSLLD